MSVEIRSAPHIKADSGVVKIMRNVVWSLLPICAFYIWQYGISALASLVVVTAACLAAEEFFLRLGRQSGDLGDWSATITGILLALTLPAGFPLWMGAVAGFVAIGLGKAIFGGIGHNLFNPALVGRGFVQAAFPTAIATYTPSFMPGRFSEFIPSSLALPFMTPADTTAWAASHLDGVSSATPLARWKFEGVLASNWDLLTSLSGTSGGRPFAAADPACGAYLAWRGYLDWRIPAAVLGSAALLAAALYPLNPQHYPRARLRAVLRRPDARRGLYGDRHGDLAGHAPGHVALWRADRRADGDHPLFRRPARGRDVRHPDRQRRDADDRAHHPAAGLRHGAHQGDQSVSAPDTTSQPQETDALAHATPTFTLLRALSVVSAVCGLIIVASYLLTLDRAKDNRRLASERAVVKVLPNAKVGQALPGARQWRHRPGWRRRSADRRDALLRGL